MVALVLPESREETPPATGDRGADGREAQQEREGVRGDSEVKRRSSEGRIGARAPALLPDGAHLPAHAATCAAAAAVRLLALDPGVTGEGQQGGPVTVLPH